MYKYLPKKSTITLNVFHLPLLILAAVVAIAGTGGIIAKSNIFNNKASQQVLSDEDKSEDKEEDKSDDNESDKDEDKNKSEESSSNKEEDNNHEERKSNNESKNKQNSINVTPTPQKVSDKDSENEKEMEDEKGTDEKEMAAEDELEQDEDKVQITSVTNPDGTITKTFVKANGNKTETKIVTYSSTGKVVSEQEIDDEGNEVNDEVQVISSVTNADGTITKTFKKTQKNETEMWALTYDQSGKLIKKVELNADGSIKKEESVDSEHEAEQEDNNEDNSFELVFKSTGGNDIDPKLNTLIKAKLKQEIESEDNLGTTVNKLALEIKTENGTIKYEGTAAKAEKLFGLFGIEVPVDIVIDPITGKITSVNQSFWSKILDFFSY